MLEWRGCFFFFLDYLNSAEQTLNWVHWVMTSLTIAPSCATGWVLQQPGFNQGPHVICLVPGLSQRRFELGKVWIQPRNPQELKSKMWQHKNSNFHNRNAHIPPISAQHQFMAHYCPKLLFLLSCSWSLFLLRGQATKIERLWDPSWAVGNGGTVGDHQEQGMGLAGL